MAREGRKEKAETIKENGYACYENGYACLKMKNQFLILHAWCVGRNFCGYLILRFFPNRKNSQNIVPANNSNNKVRTTTATCCFLGQTKVVGVGQKLIWFPGRGWGRDYLLFFLQECVSMVSILTKKVLIHPCVYLSPSSLPSRSFG